MSKIFHFIYLFYRCSTAPLLSLVLAIALFACSDRTQSVQEVAQDTSPVQEIQRDLTFNDVNLEQSDQQGRPVWKVEAKQATYSKDRKIAQVQNPTGHLFQDGKPVYEISALTGEIEQDGERLFLKGQIVAKDPRHNLVLRGNELEWRPKEDLLLVRNQLTGSHPQVQAVAQEARVRSRKGLIELQGGVQANANNPSLQMRTEHLLWRIQEQRLIGDRPLQIDRYQNKQITDRATANQGEVNLATKVTTLKQNAQISSLKPQVQINGNELSWNMNTEIVTAPQPIQIVHRQQQLTVTADRGKMDLQQEVAYLNGNVTGVGQRRQTLKSQALTWYIPRQEMEANGNVAYTQVDPPASLTGQKAVGKLQDQTLVVSGGKVTTRVVPQ